MGADKRLQRIRLAAIFIMVITLGTVLCNPAEAQAQDLQVSVTGTLSGPMGGVQVYGFTASGSYTGLNSTTDAQGDVTFDISGFTSDIYRFRVDYLGQQFWSEDIELPGSTTLDVILVEGTVDITFSSAAGPIVGARAYLFSETDSYLGTSETTDISGTVVFILPATRSFKFRGNYLSGQYWSDVVEVNAAGSTSAQINAGGGTVELFVGKDTDVPLEGVRIYLFNEGGSYLGQSRGAGSDGKAGFDIPTGRYKFRADHLGYQFWTDVIEVGASLAYDFLIPHQDVTLTVQSSYQGQETLLGGLPVYLYTPVGAYQGIQKTTETDGTVVFNLPEAEYSARAEYLDQQFWSEPFVWTDTPIDIASAEAQVSVSWSSAFLEDVPVYVFSSSGSYLGINDVTGSDGKTVFLLPAGAYRFRADYQDSQFWSGDVNLVADQENPVSISTGGGTFLLTVQKSAGQPIEGVNCYVFSASGVYLGLLSGTSSEGTASFDLADESYQCRIDYLGYSFWTPVFSVPDSLELVFDIPHRQSIVSVHGVLSGDQQPKSDVPVHLFTSDGSSLSVNALTDAAGEVSFELPDKEFTVRADYLGQQFWGDPFKFEDTSVSIPEGTVEVSVTAIGQVVSEIPIYVFSAENSSLGLNAPTDTSGIADFRLPAGSYRFRADYLGSQYWGDAEIEADVVTPVTIDAGGAEFMVTVTDGTSPIGGVNVYAFNPAGSYLGLTQTTDASGQVSFGLPDGVYRFRADFLGYQFWSADFEIPATTSGTLAIDHQEIAVTVGVDYPAAETLEGVEVYLFTPADAYLGINETTGSNGSVVFTLPDQEYKVRADYMGFQYWSETFQSQDAAVTIPRGGIDAYVTQSGTDVAGAQVYLFNEAGSYLGINQTTGSGSRSIFIPPTESFKFRVDVAGKQHWSEVVLPTGGQTDTLTVELLIADDPLNAGLVGYWNLDEESGDVAIDSSGNSNHGNVGGAVWTDGRFNNGLRFNGEYSGDYLKVPDSETLGFSNNQMTFACWIYPTDLSQEGTILAERPTADGWSHDWHIYAAHEDTPTPYYPVFRIDWNENETTDSDEEVVADIALSPDTWYFITCTYDGSHMRFYIDGVLRGSSEKSSGIIPNSHTDVWIGANDWSEEFNGTIDDVRLYDRALSLDEVQALMNFDPRGGVSLSASPNPVVVGGSTTLTWDSNGVENVSIDQGIGNVTPSGSRTVSPAETTTYTITGTANGEQVTASVTVVVSELVFTGLDSGSITADASFTIQWEDNDPDYNATISFYYDTDNNGADGILIVSGIMEDDDGSADSFLWDTSALAKGDYYIYAVIDDGVNPPIVHYSTVPVTVRHIADEFVETKFNTASITIDNRFGTSVDIDGDYAIVGATDDYDVGSAYIFKRQGEKWIQDARLNGKGIVPNGNYIEVQVSDWRYQSLMLERKPMLSGQTANLDFSGDEDLYYLTFYKPHGSGDIQITGIDFYIDGTWSSLQSQGEWISASNFIFEPGAGWRWEGPDYAQLRINGNWTAGFRPEKIRFAFEIVSNGRERPWLDIFKAGNCFVDTDPEGGDFSYILEDIGGQEIKHRAPGETDESGWDFVLTTDGRLGVDEWTPIQENGWESFGSSVAIDGDTAVVGVPEHRETNTIEDGGSGPPGRYEGAVYIFRRVESEWLLEEKLLNGDREETPFGSSVDINGDYLAVGDRIEVKIFKRECWGWEYKFKITSPTDQSSFAFGTSLDLDGDHIIIGEYNDSDNLGTAYIYERDGLAWFLKAQLTSSNAPDGDFFGELVAISGDYAVVGSKDYSIQPTAGYVFQYDGTDWVQQAELTMDDSLADPGEVTSLDIDGDHVILGMAEDDGNEPFSGAAYVFERQGDSWRQIEVFFADDGVEDDAYGKAVAADNGRFIIGAYQNDDGGIMDTGAVYIYDKPKVEARIVSDPPATTGGEVILTWHTAYADTVIIEPGIGSVDPEGSTTVTVAETTTFTITASGSLGAVTESVTVHINTSPTFSFLRPSGSTEAADRIYTIQWVDEDPDDPATISLYYDTDNIGELDNCRAGGTLIASGINEDIEESGDTFEWDTSRVPEGKYYLYAVVDDGIHDPIIRYSSSPLTISHPNVAFLPKLAGGAGHSASLTDDGVLYTWGSNSHGQLGDGTQTERPTPAPVPGLSQVVDVACGSDHTIALRADGTVWTWGRNEGGELGIGETEDKTTPQLVPGLSGVKAVSAMLTHSFALKSDGTVWAWGVNNSGELGLGSSVPLGVQTIPAQVDIDNVIAVAPGGNHTAFLKADGRVWTCGSNIYGQLGNWWVSSDQLTPDYVHDLYDVVAIACGYMHTIALKSDGTVWTWGQNDEGQLGIGTRINGKSPTQVIGLSRIRQIAAGNGFSLALDPDGSIWAWGHNILGQLGDGSDISSLYPKQVPGVSNVISIGTGWTHSFANLEDGSVWAWGANEAGQLGYDTPGSYSNSPGQTVGPDGNGYFRLFDPDSPTPSVAFISIEDVILEGQTVTLVWETRNVDSVSIAPDIGNVALNGTIEVAPAATTTYTITAESAKGTITDTVTVTVIPKPVISFSVSPGMIDEGQSATLAWDVSYADTVSIDQGIGSVDSTGTRSVSPTSNTTYTLTAAGPAGTSEAAVTVVVRVQSQTRIRYEYDAMGRIRRKIYENQ